MRPAEDKKPRVVVRGPSDPAEADRLRRAIVADLASLAVELLRDGRFPPVKSSSGNS